VAYSQEPRDGMKGKNMPEIFTPYYTHSARQFLLFFCHLLNSPTPLGLSPSLIFFCGHFVEKKRMIFFPSCNYSSFHLLNVGEICSHTRSRELKFLRLL
jgi:hypothetical protein